MGFNDIPMTDPFESSFNCLSRTFEQVFTESCDFLHKSFTKLGLLIICAPVTETQFQCRFRELGIVIALRFFDGDRILQALGWWPQQILVHSNARETIEGRHHFGISRQGQVTVGVACQAIPCGSLELVEQSADFGDRVKAVPSKATFSQVPGEKIGGAKLLPSTENRRGGFIPPAYPSLPSGRGVTR
jgi:hypothetical protein